MVSSSMFLSTDVMGISRSFRSVVGQQRVESLYPLPPDLLVRVHERLGLGDGFRVPADEAFPALGFLGHETSSFQNRHVLLHRGEGHVVGSGELAHAQCPGERTAQDVPTGGIRQRVEDPIHLFVGEPDAGSLIYNHLVVRTLWAALCCVKKRPKPPGGGRLDPVTGRPVTALLLFWSVDWSGGPPWRPSAW